MTKMFQLRPNRLSYLRIRKSYAISVVCGLMWLCYGSAAIAQANAVKWLESPHAGMDANGDGIRDDVAESLIQEYPKRNWHHWASEIARAGQRFVTSEGNPFAIYRAQSEMQRALRCLTQLGGDLKASGVRDLVLSKVLNTDARQHAYNAAIAQWEEDVRHRDLPSRPDDRWDATCGAYGKAVYQPKPKFE